ncbi:GNAT family N-acetyltransferase (plasmid) [Paenarthrobacter ureafaciens]
MTFDYAAIAASGDALLAWSDDQLVGMLITRVEDAALHIHNLAVSPDVQGLGLGSALLIEAEQLARRAGRDELCLYTNEAMLENLTFYRRRGYQETHRDIEDGFRRVYFIKRLEPAT